MISWAAMVLLVVILLLLWGTAHLSGKERLGQCRELMKENGDLLDKLMRFQGQPPPADTRLRVMGPRAVVHVEGQPPIYVFDTDTLNVGVSRDAYIYIREKPWTETR